MHVVITVIHVCACIFLVLVVLLQTGKGADMGAVFGGSSSTVFGSSGAGNFLTRLTTATAIIFMLTSLGLTYLSGRQSTATIFDSAPVAEPLPAAGGGEAGQPAAQPAAEEAAPAAAAPEAQAAAANVPAEAVPAQPVAAAQPVEAAPQRDQPQPGRRPKAPPVPPGPAQ